MENLDDRDENQEKEQDKSQKIWDICCLGALLIIRVVCCYLILSENNGNLAVKHMKSRDLLLL